MHELGIVCQVIKTVDEIATEQNIEKVDEIVLEIGELCGMVPSYVETCFPACTFDKPRFAETKLKMEIVPGQAKCDKCGRIFNVLKYEGYCPSCGGFEKQLLGGREFVIKEIIVNE